MRLYVVLEGGLVQGVYTSSEMHAEVIVIDHDVRKDSAYDEEEMKEYEFRCKQFDLDRSHELYGLY